MRGGLVACFGGRSTRLSDVEDLAGHLRWHHGAPAGYSVGPLKLALLVDSVHGPAVAIQNGGAVVVHGAEARTLHSLLSGHGRFAALEWDGRVLRASRDPMGEAPLYFRIAEDAIWLATEIHPLAALGSTAPDLEALAAEAAFVPYTMRTGREGIFRVPPAGTVVIEQSLRISISRYWRPEAGLAQRRCSYEEAVAEFRQRFERAVARCRGPSTGVLLSGGHDSAAVAVAARDDKHPLRLISVTFPELPETDETAYARATAEAAGAPLTVLRGRLDKWNPAGEEAVFGATSKLLPTGIFEVAMSAFAEEKVERVLDGHDGDGALGLYTHLYGALLAHLQIRRLIHLGRRYGWRAVGVSTLREVLPPSVRRLRGGGAGGFEDADLLSRLRPYYRGEVARRMDREMRWRSPRRSWRRFQLLPLEPPITLVPEQMEMESACLGVDLMHPFADRELLEFLVGLPFSVKVDPERSKPLLRDALTDLLPESVRLRPGKVFFSPVLDRRVDPQLCLQWIRDSGVRLPGLDYDAFYRIVEQDPTRFHQQGWIRLTRAHVFAAAL